MPKKIKQDTIQSFDHTEFEKIADKILNNTVLHVKDKTYRICEIEFYYKNTDHNDQYTHCSVI